jgi:peptidyl-prolyl cis-trans isomerase B (cyclophilin B)
VNAASPTFDSRGEFLARRANSGLAPGEISSNLRLDLLMKIPFGKNLSLVIGMALAFALAQQIAVAADDSTKPAAKPADTNEVAVITTTEGTMVVQFWTDAAPKTIANFKKLAKSGFYDGTCFHRVIKGFMVQGGDPQTKDPTAEAMWGTGGPGYNIDAEFNDHSHARGVLSMARSNDPNSAGSQFFICHGNPKFLDHQYTTFGILIKGFDVLDKIATTPTHPPDRPNKRMGVISIKIVPASEAQ